MPSLNLKISGEPNGAAAAVLADSLTTLTWQHLRKRPEVTAITVVFVPVNCWFVNRCSLSSLNRNSFYLDVKLGEGTVLKEDKAGFIREVFLLMEEHLGNLHEESYVCVEELPMDAYGFGGKTIEYRYMEKRLNQAAS